MPTRRPSKAVAPAPGSLKAARKMPLYRNWKFLVGSQLGHSSVGFKVQGYGRPLEEVKREAAEKMGSVLAPWSRWLPWV